MQAVAGPSPNGNLVVLFYANGLYPVSAQLAFAGEVLPDTGRFGSQLHTNVPLVTSVPGGPDVSIVEVKTTIGPEHLTYYRHGHGRLVPSTRAGWPSRNAAQEAAFRSRRASPSRTAPHERNHNRPLPPTAPQVAGADRHPQQQRQRPGPAAESVVALTPPPLAAARASPSSWSCPMCSPRRSRATCCECFPRCAEELGRWRARAAEIPDPVLRGHAQASLRKQGNIEGAALFATLAPAAHRRQAIRALVAYQSAYNYLDTLSEQPSADPVNNADQLDQALLIALHPTAEHADYYRAQPATRRRRLPHRDSSRSAAMPSSGSRPTARSLSPHARRPARIVDFQALNVSAPHRGRDPLESWAIETTPAGSGVAWWETAGAAGSSLAVHALIAAAADPRLEAVDVAAIDRAYFPWIGGLHSLLDSLVDRREEQSSTSAACWATTPRPRPPRSSSPRSRCAVAAPSSASPTAARTR